MAVSGSTPQAEGEVRGKRTFEPGAGAKIGPAKAQIVIPARSTQLKAAHSTSQPIGRRTSPVALTRSGARTLEGQQRCTWDVPAGTHKTGAGASISHSRERTSVTRLPRQIYFTRT